MSEMTDYQVAVAEHMATAPEDLAEYVRGRLTESVVWRRFHSPILSCGFDKKESVEGRLFWCFVALKDWEAAMATKFWRSRTAPPERPKGVIGQWYTLLTGFDGNGLAEDRKAGYTWKCHSLDEDEEPQIDNVSIGYSELYRLATPEEIKAAIQELHPNEDLEQGAKEFGEMFEAAVQFEKPEHEEYDFVNPAHYQQFSVEVIDMMAAIWGKEITSLHCEMCAFKYRLRIGNKPNQSLEDELGKINWYMEKAKELRDA